MPVLASSDSPLPVRRTAVDVVFLGDAGVTTRAGRLIAHRGDEYELSLDETPPESNGRPARVVLSILGDHPRRVSGRATVRAERRLTVRALGIVRPEKRRFPRLVAAIGLRWRHLQAEGAGAWHEPDPLMSFSVGGFAFGAGAEDTQEGALLALEFQVGHAGPLHAAVARVVRVAPRPDGEVVDLETHEVSVELTEAPHAAREALAELTLRIQRALTEPEVEAG